MTSTVELADIFPSARQLGEALHRRGMTIATAESCSGGLLSAALTAIPGASAYVIGGILAYADAVKTSVLGLPAGLIEREGAVSRAVACAMAERVRTLCDSDIGVGITGIAGPSAAGSEKPAGLIYVAAVGSQTVCVELNGDAGREANRARAVQAALDLCLELVPP